MTCLNCGREVKPPKDKNGRPYKTCSRECLRQLASKVGRIGGKRTASNPANHIDVGSSDG